MENIKEGDIFTDDDYKCKFFKCSSPGTPNGLLRSTLFDPLKPKKYLDWGKQIPFIHFYGENIHKYTDETQS